MSLAATLARPTITVRPCKLAAWLERQPDTERDAFNHASSLTTPAGEPVWTHKELTEAVHAEGGTVSRDVISRHRSRTCCCFGGKR